MSTESAVSFAGAALLVAAASAAQEIPPLPPPGIHLPRVALVSMGGEIATSCDDRLERAGCEGAGRSIGPDTWVRDLPDVRLVARVTTEDLRALSQGEGSVVDRRRMAAGRLQQLADDPEVGGVVVAHGTDRIADTAWFMNLVLDTRKPIVFVGAQRPWSAVSGDGPLNLYDAVRVAADPAAGGKGVLVATNQEVHAARDVRKTDTYRMDAFESVDLGLIGVADPDVVRFFTEPTRRHTHRSEFLLPELPELLPAVEIVPAYADAPGSVIEALMAEGAKGLVIDGAGRFSENQLAAVRRAQAAGVVVVASAATRGGRVQNTTIIREAGIIAGDNLPPGKARTLLQLALTKTADLADIQRIFDEY